MAGQRGYLLRIATGLVVSVHTDLHADLGGGRELWYATVGLGKCTEAQETPEPALDIALEAHLQALDRRNEESRRLDAFDDFLGLVDVECSNCGRIVTRGDHKEHPGKCYTCAEGR